jgi:hypothetical protein
MKAIKLAKYVERSYEEKPDRKGWVKYGDDNLFPQYLIDLANSSAVHGALVNSIALMIYGDGIELQGADQLYIQKIGLNKELRKCCLDLKLQGGFYLECHWSLDRSYVSKVAHVPYEEIRSGQMNEDGEVTSFYHSFNWEKPKDSEITEIAAWSPDSRNEEPVQLLACKLFTAGSKYYPKPDYIGSVNWIEVDKQIAIFHNSNLSNGLAPSFMVNFKNGVPTEEEQDAIMTELSRNLQGATNAGKYLVNFADSGSESPDITVFDTSNLSDQYQFLSTESTDKIIIGHRVTSPALFGVKTAGQLGATEELKTATLIFDKNVILPFREVVNEAINTILNNSGVESYSKIKSTPLFLSEKKKDLVTDSQLQTWEEYLKDKGEVLSDEWEVISVEDVSPNEGKLHGVKFFKRFANPEEKSEIDTGLYKIRYRYSQNLSEKSRTFCRNMVANSKGNVVYRYEDIVDMEGVNAQFAAKGESSYSIWLHKGGIYCHHKWERVVYFRKRDGGRFLPNDGLKNDVLVSIETAIRNDVPLKDEGKDWQEASTRPIDTPNRGAK